MATKIRRRTGQDYAGEILQDRKERTTIRFSQKAPTS